MASRENAIKNNLNDRARKVGQFDELTTQDIDAEYDGNGNGYHYIYFDGNGNSHTLIHANHADDSSGQEHAAGEGDTDANTTANAK